MVTANNFIQAYDNLISTLTGIPIKKIVLPPSVSKTTVLNDWLKNDPLNQTKHLVKDSCICENCFQEKSNYMGIIEKESDDFGLKAVENPFAVATAQAKKHGYDDFSEGSAGAKKRDEIAEALKE